MDPIDDAFRSSVIFINHRFDLNRDLNLMREGFLALESLPFSVEQTRYLYERRLEIEAVLGPGAGPEGADRRGFLVRYMTDNMEKRLVELSQYVNISGEEKRNLAGIYESLVDKVLTTLRRDQALTDLHRALQDVILEHFRSLQGFVRRIDDRDAFLLAGQVRGVHTQPCFEYSAPFQIRILGLLPSELREPILDLGCGESGLLVDYLAEKGLDVYGIDRHAKDVPRFIRSDWFSFRLEPEHWGTIISHMAFSNHFVNHLARKRGRPQLYAARFVEILNSLQPQGSFHYAPGLPFLECFLPTERYTLERRRIEPEARPERKSAGVLGEGLRYATRITRI